MRVAGLGYRDGVRNLEVMLECLRGVRRRAIQEDGIVMESLANNNVRAAATICPRPGLQVVTRYASCAHIDKSPLLYVHVGLPVQPTKAAW